MLAYLAASNAAMFYIGGFFSRGQAELNAFFAAQPWLYAIFIPVVTMRSWDKNNHAGALLQVLPITMREVTLAKFLAALAFVLFALTLTFPVWVMLNYLGTPDNGAIGANYLYCAFIASALTAICIFISASTKKQHRALFLGVLVCMVLNVLGIPLVREHLTPCIPELLMPLLSACSLGANFDFANGGLLKIPGIIYFASIAIFFVLVNLRLVDADAKK